MLGLATLLGACDASSLAAARLRVPGGTTRTPAILLMTAPQDTELLDSLRQRIESGETPRPGSIRPDGLEGAGIRYADASLASSTGPVFNADDLPEGEIMRPSQAIKGLYAAFNARDAACVASFLTEDCVYEDLLLGPATVCRGREAFMGALRFHPAFVSSGLFDRLPFAKDLLPDLTLEVDSIAEGVDTVGVEWHVQVGDSAFPLGRGLSQARVCTKTGKIERVVDIAEAPWRVIGLIALPFITLVQRAMAAFGAGSGGSAAAEQGGLGASAGPDLQGGDASAVPDIDREYDLMLTAVLVDGRVDPAEREMLSKYAAEHSVSDEQHLGLLQRAGWSEEEFRAGRRTGGAVP